jgi:rhamnosyltransferase
MASIFDDDNKTSDQKRWDLLSVQNASLGNRGNSKLAVHLHIHHSELIDEFFLSLLKIPIPFDLFISINDQAIIEDVFDKFSSVANFINVDFGPNVGRDIAPFIYSLAHHDFQSYEIGLKLHTKKSQYSEKGDFWRKRIIKGLLPNSVEILQICNAISKDSVGIVGGAREFLWGDNYWGSNRDQYDRLLDTFGFNPEVHSDLEFFAGSMFWFKPSIFSKSYNFGDAARGFQGEFGYQDGTPAHAYERLFCKFARFQNYPVVGSDNLLIGKF